MLQQPAARPSRVQTPTPPYIDLPMTKDRVVFSYLGSPSSLIVIAFALLALLSSALPLANLTVESCVFGCAKVSSIDVTAVSLLSGFPLIGIVFVGAVLVFFMPALSLFARSYGRVVRSLAYVLVGALSIFAIASYAIFYHQYSVPLFNIDWGFVFGGQKAPMLIMLNYPFYLILVSASVFIVVGILEWARLPTLLFRPYIPPPPRPPKPKRTGVPEVIPDRTDVTPSTSTPSTTLPVTEMKATRVRPLGVTAIAIYYFILAIVSLMIVPIAMMVSSVLSQPITVFPALTGVVIYIWALSLFPLALFAVLGWGLFKGRNWARVVVRYISLLGAVGTLVSLAAVGWEYFIMSSWYNVLSYLSPVPAELFIITNIALILGSVVGILFPCVIFWYLGRQHVRHYFERQATNELQQLT
jgi:hypothetical protein